MLQREMDSTVDYARPLVEPKKGFLEKYFEIVGVIKKATNRMIEKTVSRGSYCILNWSCLKSLGRFEIPAQVFSIIVLGTLLGATYAVTMQSSDSNNALHHTISSQQEVLYRSVFQKKVTSANLPSKEESSTLESEVVFSLVSILNPQEKYRISTEVENARSEKTLSSTLKPDVVEPTLTQYEQKRIKALEQQILQVQQKAKKLALSDLRLKGKLELLVIKNKALSAQLSHIDYLRDKIKSYGY